MLWSIFRSKSSQSSCMSQVIWGFAGEAACGTRGQKSGVIVQRSRSELSAPESMLRYLRDRSWTSDRNCENTLLLLRRSHAKSNGNSNQFHRSVAIDSGPNQPGESLILPAKILRDAPLGGEFLRLEPQCTMSGHGASSEECH